MNNTTSRILHIKQYLETQTDEAHPAYIADILAHLDGIGISASRKSVLSDIEKLIEAGVDVVCDKGKRHEYFIGERHFELPELKLLVDAVLASKFISVKKSKRLIEKLMTLASVHSASELNRQVYIENRVKPDNEKIYIIVDLLHRAIHKGIQVRFKYYEYDQNKKKVYKHNRQVYEFSPYGLIWNHDRYYAVGYSQSHQRVVIFRVDRIAAPKITDLPAVPRPTGFDMDVYAKSVFQMFDGPMQEVTLLCENSLMKSVIDRFGEDVETAIGDEAHFTVVVPVAASPTFFGWVFSFAGKMRILAPEDVREEYMSLASLAAGKER